MTDNDIHLDDQFRKTVKVEPYDGKGGHGGGNHPMSGEPLFKCPKFGLTARAYCYSCSMFNGLKKDHQGNLGDCDPYPGARNKVVAQIARIQPREITNAMTPEQMKKMGIRNINDDMPTNPRIVSGKQTIDKRSWQEEVQARNLYEVQKTFKKAKV